MKRLLLPLIFAILPFTRLIAQEYLAFYTSPYAGVAGVWQQPASIAGFDAQWDIVLFGGSAGAHNDFFTFSRKKVLFNLGFYFDIIQNLGDLHNAAFYTGEMSDKYRKHLGMSWGGSNPSGLATYDAALLNVMYKINDQSSVAFGLRQRGFLSIDDMSQGLMMASGRLGFKTINPVLMEIPATTQVHSAFWRELDLTYSQILKTSAEHLLKGGITARFLYEGETGFVSADDYYVADGGFYAKTGCVGYSESLQYGFGFDLGMEYEYRPESLKNDLVSYGLKAGISVLDLGYAKFKDATYQALGGSTNLIWADNVPTSYVDLANRYGKGTLGRAFSMGLPKVITAQVDVNLKPVKKGLFLNFTPIIALSQGSASNLHKMTSFNVIPHFEREKFALAIPLQYDQYRRFNAGLSVRLWQYLWMGSNTLLTNLSPFSNISKSADAYIMVKISFGKKDRDKDKIADDKDLCPDVFGLKEFQGCPDTDGDGIPDKDDRCPTLAGPIALKGCPDKDGDGIPDIDDRDPARSGTAALRGAPDKDGDGVADMDDLCPDVAGTSVMRGCPDKDGDGISDAEDVCPTTFGPRSNFGCPVPVEKSEQQIVENAFKTLLFNNESAIILSESYGPLKDLAAYLMSHPEWLITINGHTDNVGNHSFNMNLSARRAFSVKKYLVDMGVAGDRISASGFGPDQPIATNETPEGRQKNRRVDFIIKK